MDAKRFLANFATIADAPGGIQRLRDLVLELAVSGRLIEQSSSDGSAQNLLELISERSLVAESKLIDPIGTDDGPWGIPPTWRWARLKQITDFSAGRTPPTKDPSYWADTQGYHWVSIGDMPEGGAVTATRRKVTDKAVAEVFGRQPDPPGTLLMSFKLTIGKVARLAVPAFHNEAIVSVTTPFEPTSEYLFRTLPLLTRGGASKAAIMGNTLNKTSLTNLPVPMPPLAEQERIVAKVDELLELCDNLAVRQDRRHRATTRFRSSALHAVTEAETLDDLRHAWERVSANWSVTTGDSAAISALRETVAQLAVEGRLSSVHADDEPGDSILDECRRRKAELADAGGRSRSDLGPVSEDELPFPLPSGWALARLDRWCDIAGGLAKGRKIAGKPTLHLPYLRVANVKAGYLALDEIKEIEVPVDEVARYSLLPGDVLLTEGGDWDKLGRSAIWTGEIEPCLHQNHVFRARALSGALRPEWIALFTNSEAGRTYFQSRAKRTTNLASINMTELRSMPLPVPPAAEQVRILMAIEDLTSQLTRLDGALAQRDKASTSLTAGLARVASD